MLDFSMGEIGLIAAVALVVLGPDKLPQVAKTAGSLMGKAQRFVAQVKSDIDKEVELSELKKIQEDAKKMAMDLQDNLRNTQKEIEKEVSAATDPLKEVGKDFEKQVSEAKESADNVKKAWMSDTGGKPENVPATVEDKLNAVAATDATVEKPHWDIDPKDVDDSALESAFNWIDSKKVEQTPVQQPVAVSAPAQESVSIPQAASIDWPVQTGFQTTEGKAAETSAAESDMISNLAKEVERLRSLVEGGQVRKSRRRYAALQASRQISTSTRPAHSRRHKNS